jgi:hypothetical protein
MNTINNKYNIEGGIDFYSELYKSLDIEENEHKTIEDLNMCLITNSPLESNHIQLTCGHKFNYIPLYFDIKNHKQKFNSLEGTANRLAMNEIRCPYCRNKQFGLLPYYENLGIEKTHGVNYIDPEHKELAKYHNGYAEYSTCQFLTVNSSYNPDGENPEETNLNNCGNCKYYKCFLPGYKITGNNFGDEKYYCYVHKKQVIKSYKKNIATKAKEQAAKAKQEAKEQAVKAKQEAKEQAVKAKQEAKEKKKKNSDIEENKIFEPINITFDISEFQYCQYILKSGPNKGNQCAHMALNDNLCKRHFNLQNKILSSVNTILSSINNAFDASISEIKYCQHILKSGPNKGNQCSETPFNGELCKRHFNLQNKINNKTTI